MESGTGVYSVADFDLDAKWLIDPKHLFVGPRIGEGAHAKVYEGKYKNQNVAVKIVHRGETTEQIAKGEARFAREVAMMLKVQHKNSVKVVFVSQRDFKESDVDSFVDDVLVNDEPWASGVQEALTELRGLTNQVFVNSCSHIGGHKYAGNLIIYSPGSDGSITGHWYGYVTPDDVPELLDQRIGKGEIIKQLWSGQMGVSSDEAEKIDDPKLPNGRESKKIKEKPQENGNQIQKNDNFSGCCQGANSNGFTCCNEVSLEQNSGSEEKKLKETRELCAGKDAVGKLPSLIGNWEQSDVLAAAAMVGAVATVAVGYSFYRRSG